MFCIVAFDNEAVESKKNGIQDGKMERMDNLRSRDDCKDPHNRQLIIIHSNRAEAEKVEMHFDGHLRLIDFLCWRKVRGTKA